MPRTRFQHALSRSAPTGGLRNERRRWLLRAVAMLGVAILGLGVAGSVAPTGSAQNAASGPYATREPSSSASLDRRETTVSRTVQRPSLSVYDVNQRAEQRAEAQLASLEHIQRATQGKVLAARRKSLAAAAKETNKQARRLKAARKSEAAQERKQESTSGSKTDASADPKSKSSSKTNAQSGSKADQKADATSAAPRSDRASLPITSGYHIAARFGDRGPWARYHTGIDFAAPMGTTIHAAASGEVTHAGSGSASWAGHYVAIKHADGTSTLYAHMARVSVHVGESVTGGQRIGTVGMTGRSFGPHVHFEVYPAGVTPGNLYRATNPSPWLHALGLRF